MAEINLLEEYPKINRNTKNRAKLKTKEIINLAMKYDWEYFDKKGVCYGGYIYDERWIPIAKKMINYYDLSKGDKVLDIGAAKGYLIYDLRNLEIEAYGLEKSEYAIDCAATPIQKYIYLGNAKDLSRFTDKEFNLVISINTIHNLPEEDCRKAIREIQRVGKHAFITVDSYRNREEKERMMEWNITAETIKSTKDWISMFKEEGYTGDYFWFIP